MLIKSEIANRLETKRSNESASKTNLWNIWSLLNFLCNIWPYSLTEVSSLPVQRTFISSVFQTSIQNLRFNITVDQRSLYIFAPYGLGFPPGGLPYYWCCGLSQWCWNQFHKTHNKMKTIDPIRSQHHMTFALAHQILVSGTTKTPSCFYKATQTLNWFLNNAQET